MLRPDSFPITEEQLAAEIKGIYDGLVTVETKCIDIDAALYSDKGELSVEQWQALVALHRALLYEHHDFLMATQYPSATNETELDVEQWQASIALHRTVLYEHQDFFMATQHPNAPNDLKRPASKYHVPARMWKHGIHAFLKVLRHQHPDSHEYTLAFVTLAYQMTALLYETFPCLGEVWIECLGDLARYRMAIEDDCQIHAAWGCMAARWCTMASDRHPDIGRLYHHLGILERPTMRRPALYQRALSGTFGKDGERMEEPRDRDLRHLGRKNTGLDAPRYSIGVGGSPGLDSSSKEHVLGVAPFGLLESGQDTGRVGGDPDILSSWTACFLGPGFIDLGGARAGGRQQKDGTVPVGKSRVDAGRSWRSTGVDALENAGQAFLGAMETLATVCLASKNSCTCLSLLIFGGLNTVMAHPVADPLTATQETNNSNFPCWILPLIVLLLALARGCWHIITPEEDLRASSPKTTYEVVSALGFMVVEAANEHDGGTNWVILGAWLFWSFGNQVRRHRLTRRKYRERYITWMLPSASCGAFSVAAVLVRLTGSGSITRQCLDALPLGLSLSAWSLHALWSDPSQELTGAHGEPRSSAEAAVFELDGVSHRAPEIRSRSLNRVNAVSDPGDPRLEEQRLVHHRGGA